MFPQPNVINRATTAVDEGLRQHMLRVYNTMILGMLFTGIVAWYVSSTPEILQQVAGFSMPLGLLIFGTSIAFGFLINKMSVTVATAYFYAFAAAMGAIVSLYMATYTGESVARAFFSAAALFGGMSLYGYTTKKNLEGWASFLSVGVVAAIIIIPLNYLLFKSTAVMMAMNAVIVFLSAGITAYSTQDIRARYYESNGHELNSKMAIAGAFQLYVNFINMFLALLRLFGDRR
ncbi:MAG: Bax inhibitor-1/YccA family protein [Alphaproteobacteria bacterium]|jgi:FtsH-binding integral membrane protein|nr:Bax inhibitor-1/YccA family protein [Alphaproteobacteria bacterium]